MAVRAAITCRIGSYNSLVSSRIVSPGAPAALFALGTTDANGTYSGPGGRYAWQAPFVRFATEQLWKEERPGAA